MTDRDRDILIMAMTAFEEAGGEGQDGIRAQAHSLVNRHKFSKWYSGKTLAACCLLPYAYSCWLPNDRTKTASADVAMDDFTMQLCIAEVTAAIDGTTADPTDGATHYYAAGTPEPDWVTGRNKNGAQVAPPATYTKRVGKHLFYKGVA